LAQAWTKFFSRNSCPSAANANLEASSFFQLSFPRFRGK
jgi:hypothetical protein